MGGGAIVVASSIARVTSHGITEGQRKGGVAKRQGQRRIDFRWTGIRTGPSAFIGAEK